MTKLGPLAALFAVSSMLAACSQPAPQPTETSGDSGYIAKVNALAPGERAGVLYRAVRKSGGDGCQGVTKVEPMPASNTGQPMWRVTCAEGSQWMVALSDNGTALVTGASDNIHLHQ